MSQSSIVVLHCVMLSLHCLTQLDETVLWHWHWWCELNDYFKHAQTAIDCCCLSSHCRKQLDSFVMSGQAV